MKIWKEQFNNIKLRKINRFAKCSVCVELNEKINQNVTNKILFLQFSNELKQHIDLMYKERDCYAIKKLEAKENNSNKLSIIIDGSDFMRYGLPHFANPTKETSKGYKMQLKLMGVIIHGIKCKVFLIHKHWPSDPNLIIEILHRIFDEIKIDNTKSILYLQVKINNN